MSSFPDEPSSHLYSNLFRKHDHTYRRPLQRMSILFLCLLLIMEMIGNWPALAPQAFAAAKLPPPPKATMTLPNFLKQGQADQRYHGPFHYPQHSPTVPGFQAPKAPKKLLPNAEPAKMQPMTLPITASLLAPPASSATPSTTTTSTTTSTVTPTITPTVSTTPSSGTPMDLKGSDGRLEVLVPSTSIDTTQATISPRGAAKVAPTGSLTLKITQLHGHSTGTSNMLGAYQVQVVDGQGHVVHGLSMHQPLTLRYHYQPEEMKVLSLDPGKITLSWPDLISTARQAKQPTIGLTTKFTNDAKTHTLTAQTTMLEAGTFDVSSEPQIQTPPNPLMASVSGNSGQLSYSYPISAPAGPAGFSPKLQLSYSSQNTNERHNQRTPAGSVGDGWSLSLGSVTAENYPSTSASAGTWYFLNGVGGISDRLISTPVPPGTSDLPFLTQHLSYLRITLTNNCFHVWDRSGIYYELGCTSDSLQYKTDSTGTVFDYQWDVNKVVAPSNSTNQFKMQLVTYLQDSVTSNGNTTIRDSGIEQIIYGTATSLTATSLSQINGTVDFHYHAPQAQGHWADAYGTDYKCANSPPEDTTLRCDDELSDNGIDAPLVMSTLSLDRIISYVGKDDSTGFPAYRYNFSYHDDPFTNTYTDPITQLQEDAAGNHLLKSVTPIVYQNGTAIT